MARKRQSIRFNDENHHLKTHTLKLEKTNLVVRVDEDTIGIGITVYDNHKKLGIFRSKLYYHQIKHGVKNDKEKIKKRK